VLSQKIVEGTMKKCLALCVLASFVSGCATPSGMVTKREVSSAELETYGSLSCAEIETRFASAFQLESQLASDMNKRAGAQLAANVIGIAAVAVGGFGFFYTARDEGSRRDALRNARADLEAMRMTSKTKNCNIIDVEAKLVKAAAEVASGEAPPTSAPASSAAVEPESKKE
jgi:hypothetical protein